MTEFWQQCIQHLSQSVSPDQIKRWILPLTPIGFNDDETEFHIAAPSPLKQNWVLQYYAPVIEQFIKELFEHEVKVVILVQKLGSVASNSAATVTSATDVAVSPVASNPVATTDAVNTPTATDVIPQHSTVGGIEVEIDVQASHATELSNPISLPQASPSQTEQMAQDVAVVSDDVVIQGALEVEPKLQAAYEASGLNRTMTFANLVVGDSNEMAHATAKNVVRHLGKVGYNPLFIYGTTGLGKTHLMHAIGNELFRNGQIKRALYLHANTYSDEIVRLMRNPDWFGNREVLIKEYSDADLILIDDIQFFEKKERTQQEFFHLYETMVAKGKQVVISSDVYPTELPGIEDRLTSRFRSGLTIQIEPPVLEMRVAILLKKAENHPKITLTNDAAFFIAKHIRSNVRELEGILQTVIARALFDQKYEIDVDLCKVALQSVIRLNNALITVENIQKTVADYFKMRVSDIYSKSRKANIVRARHIAMYLAKELTRKSLPELGGAFGGRDHSTVHHAVEKIVELRANDRELNHDLHVLEQTLKG